MRTPTRLIAPAGLLLLAPSAPAQQLQIPWHTIDCGGGGSVGGLFQLLGTIAQHDAGPTMSGGPFELTGGFWAPRSRFCAADFNDDGAVDTRDVLAFLNAWNRQDQASDCDGNGTIDTRDVLCFLNLWTAGC